jgi:hypothetical protein
LDSTGEGVSVNNTKSSSVKAHREENIHREGVMPHQHLPWMRWDDTTLQRKRRCIMKLPYGLSLGILMSVASLVLVGPHSALAAYPSQSGVDRHLFVRGVVQSITDDAVMLQTDIGTYREFSLKQVNREKIKGVKVGSRLELEIDNNNMIIDISRATPGAVKRLEKVRVVEGKIERFDPVRKELTLDLGKGKDETYKVKDAAATRLLDVNKGTQVTLQIDPINRMVEDFN